MTVPETATTPSHQIVDPENPAVGMADLPGLAGRVVFFGAIAFCFFQIITAAFSPLSSIVLRSVHVGFLLFLTFLLFRVRAGDMRATVPWHDWLLALGAFALGLYHWVFEADLIQRAGQPNTADIIVGSVVVLLVFEAARRIMGWSLPLMSAVFIPYALFGRYLPNFLSHRGFAFEQVVDQLYLGTEGIYGVPTFVSATYIFLFILFGAFLERAGMIQLFNDVALGLVGHQKGGPAKVAVISSGLMGTINGSAIANVLTTGQFTIPLMIRFGYSRAFAGAVEATASMGGQIMPPVMGAVAFIMAETIGVPYYEIAVAALVPALLYYASAFWMVHLEAGRRNLVGMPKELCPNAWRAVVGQWHLLLPLVALVFLLFSGYTPLFAGTIGLAMTALLILGNTATGAMPRRVFRFAFWIGLGLVAALLSRVIGLRVETTALIMVLALTVVGLFLREGRTDLRQLLAAMVDAAKGALGVGVACALVGILIGVCTLTGLASDLARMVLGIAENNMLLALIMTMAACLVLGTGLPTIPTYIITSAMVAPALLPLGVPLIISHMFCFYFGIMADLTPPVALAALAAQAIANASHMRIGFIATRIALAGYVIPFMAVYAPALMLQGGTWFDTAYVVGKAVLAIVLWGAAATGWLYAPMTWVERALATAAAFLLVLAVPLTDEAGFVLAIALLAMHYRRSRSLAAKAPG
jgi:TRAP transporter 4TM/12TM fusion protein